MDVVKENYHFKILEMSMKVPNFVKYVKCMLDTITEDAHVAMHH